ncbi:hypothetical protein [Methylotuvimicrobium sp. KM2]|uniref:hypothetical protein n=1 Tax=Methylotuvimicrobium sp. KM2 TaxID=3133976 RepID=UPI0031014386
MNTQSTIAPQPHKSTLTFLLNFQEEIETEIVRLETICSLLEMSDAASEDGQSLQRFAILLRPVAMLFRRFANHVVEVYRSDKPDAKKVAELYRSPHIDNAFKQLESLDMLILQSQEKTAVGQTWLILSPVLKRLADLLDGFLKNFKLAVTSLKITESFMLRHSGREQIIAKENPDPKRFRQIATGFDGNTYESLD